MVKDIVPELNEQIDAKFKANNLRDRQLRAVSQKIDSGKANLTDAHAYAERLGINLSSALTGTLTADNLPNGKLYYNIAERTVIPALESNYDMVNEAAAKIQEDLDRKSRIGLKAVKADFPKDRIQNLIDKLTADDITADEVISWLTEPIINNSESFADEYIEANSRFRSEAGLKTKIIRKAQSNCCKWCSDIEGEYDYDSAPADIYRRHQFCRCTVTFKSEKISQNVWTKRKWTTSPEDLAARQQAGKRSEMTPAERIEQANMLYKDKVVSQLSKNLGDRQKALSEYKKLTPEQRLDKLKEYEEKRKLNNRR